MGGSSAGRIDLDLNLNSHRFESQLSGIAGMAKKAGAFAVKGLVDFGKECISLGSNLTETQNVVNMTFGSMSSKVNTFAQDAISAFGLSETTAKKYMGTFGAMSKAFGYSSGQAYDMSAALTGLTGDVASFYNLSTDEAYTKLKSVFTGGAESLMDLGVVMTQSALDAYAMANGYGKVTAKMNEQEKVGLRLAFVQNKLSLASGDFARTSGSWANQVRLLSLQFDQFKATIGQGLINAFTPILQVVNTLLTKVMALATAFRAFTAAIFGDRSGANDAAESMGDLSERVEGVGDATAGTAKQMKASLAGFDRLNILSDDSSSSGDGSSGSATAGTEMPVSGEDNTVLAETNKQLDGILGRIKKLAKQLMTGFKLGLGDVDVSAIGKRVGDIQRQLQGLFTSEEVTGAAKRWMDGVALNLGAGVGALVSIGTTIAQNLLGGFNQFLSERGEALKGLIVSAFDVSTEIGDLRGRLAVVVGEIFSVFGGDNAQRVTAVLLQMFVEPFANMLLLAQKFGRDLLNMIVQPLEENAEQIKSVVDSALGSVASVFEDIANVVTYAFETMQAMYDAHVAPMLQSFADGVSDLIGVFLDAWEANIQPVLDALADKFHEVVETHVKPMIEQFSTYIGKLCDAVKVLWEKWLQPLAAFIVENAMPAIGNALDTLGNTFSTLLTTVSDVLNGIFKALGGLMDFITGVLTGDWDKAWSGLGNIVGGVFDSLVALVKAPLNLIIALVNGMLGAIETGVNGMISAVNKLSFTVPDWVPGIGGEEFGFNFDPVAIPRIKALAEGGYVRANTPQLAMIGDNKTQGEIVAPEGKLAELLKAAVSAGGGNTQVVVLLTAILELMKSGAVVVYDDKVLGELVLEASERTRRTGNKPLRG